MYPDEDGTIRLTGREVTVPLRPARLRAVLYRDSHGEVLQVGEQHRAAGHALTAANRPSADTVAERAQDSTADERHGHARAEEAQDGVRWCPPAGRGICVCRQSCQWL